MTLMKIVIPDDAPPVMGPSAAYQTLIIQTPVDYHDTLPGSEERLIERIAAAGVVINIRSSSKFTARVLESAPRLRLLSLWGTGTDNVDLDAAGRRGITVTNTPGVAAPAIAEHCVALMLAVARRIPRVDAEVRLGAWPRAQSVQLRGKTLGVIGLGAIGSAFARLAEALGLRVVSWTMNPKPELGFAHVPLDELYRTSDVVSLHLRLSEKTEKFLGRREIERMKPSAILINTARGPIVDEAALIEALSTRRIAGAGLDVFETEPLPAGHPLTLLDNVVLTPHSAGITPETLEAGLALAIENVTNFQAGHPTNVVA
jgi:phosphoglycerate dehydrogenase-like enzyme